jgi:tetratricopeptide (TPR) repeat protein
MRDDTSPTLESELDAYIAAFEGVRAVRAEADLADFLPDPGHRLYRAILRELVRVDLEYGWTSGCPRSLDDYRNRFPDLFNNPDDARAISFEEYRLRQQAGGNPLPAEYRQRFGVNVDDWPTNGAASLPDYENLGELGHGSMGIVYKARHRRLKRLVALKMVHPGRIPSPRLLERFRGEAETIARLQHPNIVQIFEVGESQGLPFLSLELAEGGTLDKKLREVPLTFTAAAELVQTLARAIQHAHQQHIVHRDLKPANVLFAKDGTPKITDFGLAKILEEDPDSPRDPTRSGETIGTPRYMSPEQIAGHGGAIGPATDVYALGALLYECLTGQAPFFAPRIMETLEKIRTEDPVPPRRLQSSIPRDLETICLTCLHKQSARRYASALALADDLDRFLNGEPIRARPTPRWERAWKWARRHPARAALTVCTAVLLIGGLLAAVIERHLEQQRLAKLRQELAGLVREGQDALERQDVRTAKARFLTALTKVIAEPALRQNELGVAGWLDHALREDERERWTQRRPPPLFNDLRDEAVFLTLLSDQGGQEAVQAARQAIDAALELTDADDPAWRSERQQLVLLDAGLLLRQGQAREALAVLDREPGGNLTLWQRRRADCLKKLGEKPQDRPQADAIPAATAVDVFLSGVQRLERQDFAGAARDLERVLTLEPDHFRARFLQAACFLRLGRPAEAKVGLTACVAQRPGLVWCYLYRGLACAKLEDEAAAFRDFQRVLDLNPGEPIRQLPAFREMDRLMRQGKPSACKREERS